MSTLKEKIQETARTAFIVLALIITIAKISNWFLNYDDSVNDIINNTMFALIGLSYLVYTWALDQWWLKLIVFLCGVYLLSMSFLNDFSFNFLFGIISIVVPMMIAKVLPVEEDENEEEQTINPTSN